MDLSAIVEVAIGIIFVWIVLSLATIQLQEWIITRMDKRARDLEDALEEMLANKNLMAQFYDHPIIRGLTAKKRKSPSKTAEWFYRLPLIKGFTKERRKLPSYIPKQQFALALFDIAMTAGTEASLAQQVLLGIREQLKNKENMSPKDAVIVELNVLIDVARSAAATEAGTAFTQHTMDTVRAEKDHFLKNHPEYRDQVEKAFQQAGEQFTALKKLLDDKKAPKGDDALASLRRGIVALGVISPEFNQTLNALLLNVEDYVAEGETHIARARQNVERWFDDSMDRVSGVFKRYSQWLALVIGLLLSLLLNVDSINLTLYLWRDPSVRQLLAAKASEFQLPEPTQNNPQQAVEDIRNQFTGLNLPIGWGINQRSGAVFADANCQLFPGDGQAFGIPFFRHQCIAPAQANERSNLLVKLLGIVITALAARQGAPFWFDMLKRLVNLRGTGPNPTEQGK